MGALLHIIFGVLPFTALQIEVRLHSYCITGLVFCIMFILESIQGITIRHLNTLTVNIYLCIIWSKSTQDPTKNFNCMLPLSGTTCELVFAFLIQCHRTLI